MGGNTAFITPPSGSTLARSLGDCEGSGYVAGLTNPIGHPGVGCGFDFTEIKWHLNWERLAREDIFLSSEHPLGQSADIYLDARAAQSESTLLYAPSVGSFSSPPPQSLRDKLLQDQRAVDALRVNGKDALFWDRDLASFGVRVHTTGRKAYVVQSRGPRGPKRVTLGRHGEMSSDEARKQAAEVIDRIKRGEDALQAPEPTVADLGERFMRVHAGVHLKSASAAAYRSVLDGSILLELGAMTLKEIGQAEVSALHHRLRETPVMANRVVHLLSTMFTQAEAWGWVSPGRNPCRGLRRYRTRPRERFLTTEEYRRLGRALKDMEDAMWPPAVAAIRLLTLTGCRKGEILDLHWDDVDRTTGDLRLKDAKAGPRMQQIDGAWRVILERAGLEGLRIHDLRHSFASRALALGEPLPMIGCLLGHSRIETTARYAHLARFGERGCGTRRGKHRAGSIRWRSAAPQNA